MRWKTGRRQDCSTYYDRNPSLSSSEAFWKPSLRIQLVETINMPRNRFEKLRNNLHLVDATQEPNKGDKLESTTNYYCFQKRCSELKLEEHLCIDESMIPFKGQLSIKQYIRNKPSHGESKFYALWTVWIGLWIISLPGSFNSIQCWW